MEQKMVIAELVQLPLELLKQLEIIKNDISRVEQVSIDRDILNQNIDSLQADLRQQRPQLMNKGSKISFYMDQIKESALRAYQYQNTLEFIISRMKVFINQANQLEQKQIYEDDLFDRDSEIKKESQFEKLLNDSLGAYLRSLENGLYDMEQEKEKQKYIDELLNAKKEEEKLLKKQINESKAEMRLLKIFLEVQKKQSAEHNQTITQLNRELEQQNQNIQKKSAEHNQTITQLNIEIEQQNQNIQEMNAQIEQQNQNIQEHNQTIIQLNRKIEKQIEKITFLNETIQIEREAFKKVCINRNIKF